MVVFMNLGKIRYYASQNEKHTKYIWYLIKKKYVELLIISKYKNCDF